MSHSREEVQGVLDRWVELRRRIDAGEEKGFDALAPFYTDDVVVVDAAWGRLEGIDEVSRWFVESMVGLEGWKFPVEFTAIDGDNVIVKWTQMIPGVRQDGSGYRQSAYSWLIYAGDGKFCYEEDMYNMVHVLEDLAQSGWQPTEPMNLPPEHPDRDFSPPRAGGW